MDNKYFLKKNTDFVHVYRKRKTFGNRNFTLYVRKNTYDYSRMGFSISKKVGKAVIRNLIKRRLRALYKEYSSDIIAGYDMVLVVKPNVADLSYEKLESAFSHILKVSKMKKKKKE
ncbi:MAG: ribonuclease P protein component [Tissierellia bacterium]|nr:ribonuclease P protein component [Tissierellia bacterium]